MTYITRAYCENAECNVRQMEITTKDYDRPDPEVWHCPGCGQVSSVHGRRTLREHEEAELKTAISRVNCALYVRDHADSENEPPGTPVKILMCEELPAAWKAIE